MLNIPESIKALYLADTDPSVQRNFRVRFPNGEIPDVNSDQIVQDSVQLTESIMSQNTFKFGLAEAPQIQFETVGVANMMGMSIECSHEIETSSLTAEELADIQSGDYDGELVLEEDSDLGYGFYRTPLGIFRVESCPRNQGAMTHRRVTAVGADNASSDTGSAFRYERWKAGLYFSADTATIDLSMWLYAVLGIEMLGGSVTANTFSGASGDNEIGMYNYYDSLSINRGRVRLVIKTASYSTLGQAFVARVNLPDVVPTDTALAAFETAWTEAGADSVPGAADAKAEFLALFTQLASWGEDVTDYSYDHITSASVGYVRGVMFGRDSSGFSALYPITQDTAKGAFYQPIVGDNNSGRAIIVPVGFYIDAWNYGGSVVTSQTHDLLEDAPTFTAYTFAQAGPQYTIKATGTRETETVHKYTFSGALPMVEMANGALELAGIFGHAGRNGGYSRAALDDSNPYEMPLSQYSELWYDEYNVSDIALIYYTYTNDDGVQQLVMNLNNGGGSVYDLSGNWILQNIPTTQAAAEDMITTYFVPNIGGVDFTPIDLDAKGLPWLEAGDAIAVTTEDGETVTSYILERTLSGIQALSDDIKSTGGELLSADTVEYGS
ncbi:MAG: hypothetical protein IJ110_01440 [Lachnospiraceae bacterium]|nr:hypothetical protein [Lachnospiraceae bacterium]